MFLGFDCTGANQNLPKPTPVVKETDYCSAAERRLLQLHCSEGNPTKRGKTFTQFCYETQNNGIFLNPKCLAQITGCEQIESCDNASNDITAK